MPVVWLAASTAAAGFNMKKRSVFIGGEEDKEITPKEYGSFFDKKLLFLTLLILFLFGIILVFL